MTKVISRRKFFYSGLAGCVSLACGSLLIKNLTEKPEEYNDVLFAPAHTKNKDKFFLGVIRLKEMRLDFVQVPIRGHSIIQSPTNKDHVVMFAHKPGNLSFLIDIKDNKLLHVWESKKGKYFYGHGAFSEDDKYIFSTETNLDSGNGIISVRDSKNYNVIGEFPSHGKDPHQIVMSPDKKTIIVANGGLGGDAHLVNGRVQFDQTILDSSVCFIDSKTGELKKKYKIKNSFQSIRHAHVFEDGSAAFAMQLAVPKDDKKHDNSGLGCIINAKSDEIIELKNEKGCFESFMNHALSVTGIMDQSIMAMTHPFGNQVSFWNTKTGKLINRIGLPGRPAGIAVTKNKKYYIITGEAGVIYTLRTDFSHAPGSPESLFSTYAWDSHLTSSLV